MKKYLYHDYHGGEVYSYSSKSEGPPNAATTRLFFSKTCGHWPRALRGKLAGKIHDDGNGMIVRLKDCEPFFLDYSQAYELKILLDAHGTEDAARVER